MIFLDGFEKYLYNPNMSKKVSDKKVESYGRAKWFSIFAISFILLYLAISFINNADYFADNIKFLLDDPYIYWFLGWILFVLSLVFFAISFIKFFKLLLQYFKNLHNKNAGSEE